MNGSIIANDENLTYHSSAVSKATTQDGIPVYCSHDELVPLKDLKPNPKNPNTHPVTQIRVLAKIISQNGWRQPITVSTKSGLVVKGHGRMEAAEYMDWTDVPVDYQDYTTMEEEYADLLADNRLAELSEMDNEVLVDMLKDIADFDEAMLDLTGYDKEDISELVAELSDNPEEEEQEQEEYKPPLTPFCKYGDVWQLGEHRLLVADEDCMGDFMVSSYVYQSGNVKCTCVRDNVEYDYLDLLRQWAIENNVEEEVFKAKKPIARK